MITLPRNAQLWLPGYFRSMLTARDDCFGTVDVLLCIADHFEPANGSPGLSAERRRVAAWVERYPRLAEGFRDADGRPPRHTFFFPAEAYRSEHIAQLGSLCRAGLAEVEVHLHHDRDSADNLRRVLSNFTRTLHERHGLLTSDREGIRYGFVHGDWALDNARADGRHCGVTGELEILRETGCYADFTMPAAPDPSQARVVNAIYHAGGHIGRSRAHDQGRRCVAGVVRPEHRLLLIQGPLALDWSRRRFGILPSLETGAIDGSPGHLPAIRRFRRWVDVGIAVARRPEWVFVKLHTHGGPERNAETLLGPHMKAFHEAIGSEFNDGNRYRLHYVTAREMVNIVEAAEGGCIGDAGRFRDFRYPPPPIAGSRSSPVREQAHRNIDRGDHRDGETRVSGHRPYSPV